MIYDYQNCIDFAREQGFAKGEAKGLAKGLAKGKAEGKAEGLAEGEVKGLAKGEKLAKIETAKNFKNKGIASEIISECTGLSMKEIQAL